MNTSRFFRIRAFLSKYGLRIFIPLLLLILSYMSVSICREPVAGGLPVAEQCTVYLFPAILLLSVAAAALARYFISLCTFIGYHAGLALALIGTKNATEGFLISGITLMIFLILGVWAEIFAVLLPKWKAEHKKEPDSES